VLKPGGRFAVSDVIADPDMDDATRSDMAQFTGCIAGAPTREQFDDALQAAGLAEITIQETHRVHMAAVAVTVRARKPASGVRESRSMSQDNIQLARRGYEAMLAGDLEVVEGLLDQASSGTVATRRTRRRVITAMRRLRSCAKRVPAAGWESWSTSSAPETR
jgi:hypothetical protein